MGIHLIRFAVIGLFSTTAVSLMLFQSVEVVHAFMEAFTNLFKQD